jgi:ankyrin repeat protein
VNAKDSKGNTPLALGAWADTARCEDVVDTLLKNGADPSVANAEGVTAIHHACQSGKPYVVMILLDAGASPHLVNAKGETPLDVAALYGKEEVVSFLIDHDNTVIHSTRSLLDTIPPARFAVAKLLLDFGMNSCATQETGTQDSALHLAVRFYRVEMVSNIVFVDVSSFCSRNAFGGARVLLFLRCTFTSTYVYASIAPLSAIKLACFADMTVHLSSPTPLSTMIL